MKGRVLVSKTLMPLQSTIVTEVDPAERQFLIEEQMMMMMMKTIIFTCSYP
jgi:hypothetical protein